MIGVCVLFFASAKEITGINRTKVEMDENSSTDDLIVKLVDMFPGLDVKRDRISIAVNQTYCKEAVTLKNGDEVALLPPISGG